MTEPFISINELSKRLGVPAHTLRYWEKQFSGTIRPITGAGGRRYYREEDVEKIASIKDLLYDQGYTIAGVKKLLADNSPPWGGAARKGGGGGKVWAKPSPALRATPPKEGNSEIEDALSLLAKARMELNPSC